jgi:activator of 2-hydroxyglutaryl-CoA dehydratase
MVGEMRRHLGDAVRVPPDSSVQFTGAIGAALLARRRLEKLRAA